MIGELHHLGRKRAKERATVLLEQFTLTDAGDKLAKEYSGGMRRRLDLAATLVAEPGGPVPRRADHGPGPAGAQRPLGRAGRPRRRRRHDPVDHAVPGRG